MVNGMTDYEKIYDFSNLYQAHLVSRKGKRNKREVIRYEMNLAYNLTLLSEQLKNNTYKMKGYYHFTIYEPKQREIYAPYYSDRIVAHCICDQILMKTIGNRLIYDNVACQKGKGTHFAVKRWTHFLHSFYKKYGQKGYILKCDISKYFANIPHNVLKIKLKKIIKDERLLNLLFEFIDSYETEGKEKIGIPLGNQTSQWFALYYLDSVDRLIKEQLQIKYYIRYMDDFLLLHHDKDYLKICLEKIRNHIEHELQLELNTKTQIIPLKQGIEFLGWKFYVKHTGKIIRKLKQQSKVRFKRKIKKLKEDKDKNKCTIKQVKMKLASHRGHLKYGHTYQLRRTVYKGFWK